MMMWGRRSKVCSRCGSGCRGVFDYVEFLYWTLFAGGAERLIVDAAVELSSHGHNVHLFTSHHDTTRCFEETLSGSPLQTILWFWLDDLLLFCMVDETLLSFYILLIVVVFSYSFLLIRWWYLNVCYCDLQASFRSPSMVISFRGTYSIVYMPCVHTWGASSSPSACSSFGLRLMSYWRIRYLSSFHSWS